MFTRTVRVISVDVYINENGTASLELNITFFVTCLEDSKRVMIISSLHLNFFFY